MLIPFYGAKDFTKSSIALIFSYCPLRRTPGLSSSLSQSFFLSPPSLHTPPSTPSPTSLFILSVFSPVIPYLSFQPPACHCLPPFFLHPPFFFSFFFFIFLFFTCAGRPSCELSARNSLLFLPVLFRKTS